MRNGLLWGGLMIAATYLFVDIETPRDQTNGLDMHRSFQECFLTHNVKYTTHPKGFLGQTQTLQATTIQGKLHSRHWRENDQQFSLFLMTEVQFIPHQSSQLINLYYQPLMTKNSPPGLIETLYFHNQTASEDEKLLSGLILPFQNSRLEGRLNSFDTLGEYSAFYKIEKSTMLKQKQQYIAVEDFGNIQSTINIIYSASQYELNDCWLESFSGRERLAAESTQSRQFLMDTEFAVQLDKVLTKQNALNEYQGQSFIDILTLFKQAPKRRQGIQSQINEQTIIERIAKQNLTSQQLIENVSSSKQSLNDYAAYLRAHPDKLAAIINKVINGNVSPEQHMYLTELLALTGNDMAQLALIEIAQNINLQENRRLQAMVALSSLTQPVQQNTVTSLLEYTQLLDSGFEFDLSSTAILSLGSLSRTLDKNDPTLSESIIEHLNLSLQQVINENSKRSILLALANAATAELSVEKYRSYLEDSSGHVRHAAIKLLTQIGTTDSINQVLSHQANEKDRFVKAESYRQLKNTLLSDKQLEDIAEKMLSEPSANVRLSMIQLLGQHIERSFIAREALEAFFKIETDINNQKQIARFL